MNQKRERERENKAISILCPFSHRPRSGVRVRQKRLTGRRILIYFARHLHGRTNIGSSSERRERLLPSRRETRRRTKNKKKKKKLIPELLAGLADVLNC